jgi:hypothetical protein
MHLTQDWMPVRWRTDTCGMTYDSMKLSFPPVFLVKESKLRLGLQLSGKALA